MLFLFSRTMFPVEEVTEAVGGVMCARGWSSRLSKPKIPVDSGLMSIFLGALTPPEIEAEVARSFLSL